MDRTIVPHDDQRLEAFPLAIGLADMVEQADKVARALGGTGMNEKLALGRVEGPKHRTPLGLARCLEAQIQAALGPAMRQVRMGERLCLVEEEEIKRADGGLPPQLGQSAAAGGDSRGVLTVLQRMPWPAPAEPLCRNGIESQPSEMAGPPRRSISTRSLGKVQPRSWLMSSARTASARAAAAVPCRSGSAGPVADGACGSPRHPWQTSRAIRARC